MRRTWTMARPSSSSNAPVVASAMAKTPMTSIASHGVPPALTRASAAGANPSRASPHKPRGGTNTLPVKDAHTPSNARPATGAPPPPPPGAPTPAAPPRLAAAHPPPRRDAHQVDPREQRDQSRAQRRRERGRPAGEPYQELPCGHADRGDRHAVGAQGLDPTHHESGAGAERLAHEGVLAGGARLARGELGEAQRAQERQRGTQYPDHEGEPRAAESRGHDSGSTKDPGADGHPP